MWNSWGEEIVVTLFFPLVLGCDDHLAVICHIGIVAVGAALAGELVDNILADTEIEQNSEFLSSLSSSEIFWGLFNNILADTDIEQTVNSKRWKNKERQCKAGTK